MHRLSAEFCCLWSDFIASRHLVAGPRMLVAELQHFCPTVC